MYICCSEHFKWLQYASLISTEKWACLVPMTPTRQHNTHSLLNRNIQSTTSSHMVATTSHMTHLRSHDTYEVTWHIRGHMTHMRSHDTCVVTWHMCSHMTCEVTLCCRRAGEHLCRTVPQNVSRTPRNAHLQTKQEFISRQNSYKSN